MNNHPAYPTWLRSLNRSLLHWWRSVSYTHLDVYKRQGGCGLGTETGNRIDGTWRKLLCFAPVRVQNGYREVRSESIIHTGIRLQVRWTVYGFGRELLRYAAFLPGQPEEAVKSTEKVKTQEAEIEQLLQATTENFQKMCIRDSDSTGVY